MCQRTELMENNWISFLSTVEQRQKQLMHALSMGATGILAAKERLKPLKELCKKMQPKENLKTQKTAPFTSQKKTSMFHTYPQSYLINFTSGLCEQI